MSTPKHKTITEHSPQCDRQSFDSNHLLPRANRSYTFQSTQRQHREQQVNYLVDGFRFRDEHLPKQKGLVKLQLHR